MGWWKPSWSRLLLKVPRDPGNNDLQNIPQPVYLLVRQVVMIRKLIKDQAVRIYIEETSCRSTRRI